MESEGTVEAKSKKTTMSMTRTDAIQALVPLTIELTSF
jgi:hypothetical protein